MVVGIVMDPTCFAPESLATPEAQFGAVQILEGGTNNGVLLAVDSRDYYRDLRNAALRLGTPAGQEVNLWLSEIGKKPDNYIASDRSGIQRFKQSIVGHLRHLAVELQADIVVCRDAYQVKKLSDLRCKGIEVCTISKYRSSETEAKRKEWCRSTRIDRLPAKESLELVGRMIRYVTEIIVVDRYFGVKAKEGYVSGGLKRFVRGLVYLANCWKQHSPYAMSKGLTIQVVSVAGAVGAASGYIHPKAAETAIRNAVSRLDTKGNIGTLDISLKADARQALINDRFIAGMGRCFGIQHGIDDLGNLMLSASNRRRTSLTPDCPDHRDLLTEIQALRPAQ